MDKFEQIERSARRGNAESQVKLGDCYRDGNVVAQDYSKAVEWYRKAASSGNADAQNRLGVRYSRGEGVERDDAKAFEWYLKAAKQGNMKAQMNIGAAYCAGEGVPIDLDKGAAWIEKAANQGYEPAKQTIYLDNIRRYSGIDSVLAVPCTFFQTTHFEDTDVKHHIFSNSTTPKGLRLHLHVPFNEKIYVAMDCSPNGDRTEGFALTESCLRFREGYSDPAYTISYDNFSGPIKVDGCTLLMGGDSIASWYGYDKREVLKALKKLFKEIVNNL